MQSKKDIFYKMLIQHYGFYMSEYYSESKKRKQYIAIKEVEEGSYAVVITNEVDENIDLYEAEKYMKTRERNFSVNVVVFCEQSYEGSNVGCGNKIVIGKDNNIIFCSDRCRALMNIFLNIRENNIGNINNVYKTKGKNTNCDVITCILISINIILFLITVVLTILFANTSIVYGININILKLCGAKVNSDINNGQYYRFITCMFLHGGVMHLLGNMYSLYVLGPQINFLYGKIRYISLYFICGIFASFASFVFLPNSISVGASGAIYGLVGSLLAFVAAERKNINKKYISDLIVVVVINLVIGIRVSNIDNYAHFGGLISGFFIGILFYITKNKK